MKLKAIKSCPFKDYGEPLIMIISNAVLITLPIILCSTYMLQNRSFRCLNAQMTFARAYRNSYRWNIQVKVKLSGSRVMKTAITPISVKKDILIYVPYTISVENYTWHLFSSTSISCFFSSAISSHITILKKHEKRIEWKEWSFADEIFLIRTLPRSVNFSAVVFRYSRHCIIHFIYNNK